MIGIALAHVILAAPFAVLVLVSTFEGMDPRLLEAGAVMGCGPLRLFWRVTMPLALPGIVAAALFAFLASYNDFVLTLMVYGTNTVTLPVQTYLSIGNGYLSVAAAISTILLIPSLLFLLGMMRMVNPGESARGAQGRMTATRLELEHVGKNWGRMAALTDICLSVPRGMFLSLLGPSGCGEDDIAACHRRHAGARWRRVRLDGADITGLPTHRRNMGMVFQSFALLPHLSVADNVGFPLRARRAAAERRGGWPRRSEWFTSTPTPRAIRASCRAVSSSGWDWRVRSFILRPSCCSMNRCPISMRRCAKRCGWRSAR